MPNQKQNFTRSNVNEQTLQISAPNRSSFDLSHRVKSTFKLGVLHPVNVEYLTPTDMVRGSLSPNLQLEKVATPELGRVRMDTHTFLVHSRRINKDWKQFIESAQNGAQSLQTKPTFYPAKVFAYVLWTYINKSTSLTDYDVTFADILQSLPAEDAPESLAELKTMLFEHAISKLQSFTNDARTDNWGYCRDFFELELERVKALYAYHQESPMSFAAILAGLTESFFGPESIFDALGYPLFRQYCPAYQVLEAYESENEGADLFGDIMGIKFSKVFEMVALSGTEELTTVDFGLFDEMPLRAIYAAWYDYLRNYHVEKRVNVLDPDLFGATSLLTYSSSAPYKLLYDCVQLLVPKFRMFQRDGLTTIQEDDVYRHVYAPVMSNVTSDVKIEGDPIGSDNIEHAIGIALDGLTNYFPFLGNSLNLSLNNGSSIAAYKLDLQTMRRTGMLEKYLARDYYNPDTYAGYIRARYSVVPDDIAFLSSVYLGGDEKFIDGSQEVANVSTDSTPAGTRTFTGGGSLTDSFSYRASDYGYIVNFVSLMPMVTYDAANMHAHELTPFDLPSPEFATDTRVAIQAKNMLRGMEQYNTIVGYVPRFYGYRCRLDRATGKYLTDKRACTWLRDWWNMYLNEADKTEGFELTPYALRVHLALDAFLNLQQWDSIAYGAVDIQMIIDRPLPAAVEFI